MIAQTGNAMASGDAEAGSTGSGLGRAAAVLGGLAVPFALLAQGATVLSAVLVLLCLCVGATSLTTERSGRSRALAVVGLLLAVVAGWLVVAPYFSQA